MDDPQKILDQIKPCLNEWGISTKSIRLVSHSENIVYRVEAEDGQHYALRVHRPGYHTLAELNSEQIWTDALSRSGLNVPKAYKTRQGNYFAQVPCNRSIRSAGLVAWFDGIPLNKILKIKKNPQFHLEKMTALGRICARMHNQASVWHPPHDFDRHHLNAEGLMGEEPFWGRFWEIPALTPDQRNTILKAREKITEQLLNYGENSSTYSMIHADLHHENLLVSDDELMVIDFDDAGFGWHLYDLAVALMAYMDRKDFEALKSALITGYRQERELSEANLALLPLFILVRTLALMGWAQSRPELEYPGFIPHLIAQACKQAKTLAFV